MDRSRVTREDLVREAAGLLASLDGGAMSATAYDTAWVARLASPANPEEPLFPSAFDWLLRHQHPNGSWGAEILFAHDRVISTVAALVTLAGTGYRKAEAEVAVRRGVVYLNRERPNLREDPAETVGFELLLPELARQARALGLRLPYQDWAFVEAIKADKLRRIPPIAVYGGPTTLTHSLEYLGDRLAPMLVRRCQSPNGSYGISPSTTAFVHTRVPDADTARYLARVAEVSPSGGVPYVHPFETFETSWVLYALQPLLRSLPEAKPLIDRLANAWTAMGAAWTSENSVPDGDDSAVTLSVLTASGRVMDTDVFALFEGTEYFHTFAYERDPSVTTNAHVLYALRQYPSTPDRRRMILKIAVYLRQARAEGRFWEDKWHASPYYATAQAIAALAGISSELVRPAVHWLLDTQHEQGGWGFGAGTVEETAWAVHALMDAREAEAPLRGLTMPAVERGGAYLAEHLGEDGLPALWIGKSLYVPYNIVRAAFVGALARWQASSAAERP